MTDLDQVKDREEVPCTQPGGAGAQYELHDAPARAHRTRDEGCAA